MAITWTSGPKAGTTEFVGCVLDIGVRTIRVMSDVWEDERYAEIWDGEKLIHPALSDFAYVMPDGTMSKEWKEGAEWTHFFPQAEVDATEETLAAVAEWRRVNEVIRQTRRLYDEARQLRHGRRVEVHAGRKVPKGDCYEISMPPVEGQFGPYLHLRHIREDQTYRYVSVENVRVHEADQYIDGPVACSRCRTEWTTWQESTLAMRGGIIICRDCQWKAILDDEVSLPKPKDAKPNEYAGHFLTPKEHRLPEELGFARAIFDAPDDSTPWLIYSDWLEENLPDGEEAMKRAEAIRLMTGWVKPKKVSYRKKDLRVSPLEKCNDYGGYYCYIDGFPPFKAQDGTEVVKLRAYVHPGHALHGGLAAFDAQGETIAYRYYSIPAALKRLAKQVVPTHMAIPAEVPA